MSGERSTKEAIAWTFSSVKDTSTELTWIHAVEYRVITLEVTDTMRDDVILHSWKQMKLDRCRVTWGVLDMFRFPNGISVRMSYGWRPFKIAADEERTEEIEFLLMGMESTKKMKKGRVEFSVKFENRGRYLDLLWG
ncbi:MAG: hypothetical protein ACFFFC_15365, partial [Candidatus Thorarchaeota archaeon]